MKKEVDIEIRKAQNKENKENKIQISSNKDIVENTPRSKNKSSKQKWDASKTNNKVRSITQIKLEY